MVKTIDQTPEEKKCIVETVVDELKESMCIEKDSIGVHDIPQIVGKTMQFIQRDKTLDGKTKKELVIEIVKEVIRQHVTDESVKSFLLGVSEGVVSEFIDLIVATSKGKFKLNELRRSGFFCCR